MCVQVMFKMDVSGKPDSCTTARISTARWDFSPGALYLRQVPIHVHPLRLRLPRQACPTHRPRQGGQGVQTKPTGRSHNGESLLGVVGLMSG